MRTIFSFLLLALTSVALSDEREVTPEQQAAIAGANDQIPNARPERPANLTDFTKGEVVPPGKKGPPRPLALGPTGIVGIMNGEFAGDQIQVQATRGGSPSEGKLQWGDVITGINGKPFVAGEHMGYLIGKEIIEAEKEENGGKLTLQVWRDENFITRNGKKNLRSRDIDEVFDEARDDNSLYEWKDEESRTYEAAGFLDFPIKPTTFEVDLTIRVMPPYSDTSPYDCPKSQQILEDAWKVLEKKFVAEPGNPRSGRGGMMEALALVASGKPEHRELVRKWVRSPHAREWHPPTEPIGSIFEPGARSGGKRSWSAGYTGLNCALYYEATGDEFVLPALRKIAIETAMGQSAGGTWGHTFAMPSFNGGEFHRMNPGYGALNAAGNRCFFLITLAQKLGIDHPEIDDAVERSHRFFGSYVDEGAIPYGDHPAAGTDDSNGKNTGVAFSMKLLGDKYGAKYFGMMSTHCSFTRRGGHGHDYHGNWSFWAASLCGPEVRILGERNMRWRRTLDRQHDGSFVNNSRGHKTLRDPTATAVLTYSVPLKQTLITGKDPDEDLYPTEREIKQLMASAYPQLNDEELIEQAGTPWRERSTEELYDLLDIFMPKARRAIAAELGRRFQEGEKEIADRLVDYLGHESARYRDGALHGLRACGPDTSLQFLSKITPLLDDPHEVVRVAATKTITDASLEKEESQIALLKATVDDPRALSPNNLRVAAQLPLFGVDTKLANDPFGAGIDEELVRKSLEKLICLDPVVTGFVASRQGVWSKDTVVRLAGPLTFAAEEEQLVEQMFANRSEPAWSLLKSFNFEEGVLALAHRLRKLAAVPRDTRPHVGFKRNLVDPEAIRKYKGAYRDLLDDFRAVLIADPLETVTIIDGKDKIPVNLSDLMKVVEADEKAVSLSSLENEVMAMFQAELDSAGGTSDQIKHCRVELKDPNRKTYFRQMAAMTYLTETLGSDALVFLLPYLDHDYFRLREHSQKLASEMVMVEGEDVLLDLYAQNTDPPISAGILEVLRRADSEAGVELATEALKSEHARVRNAGIRVLYALAGSKSLPEILSHFEKATDREDFRGVETALASQLDDPESAVAVRDALIEWFPRLSEKPEQRSRSYWVLGQIGDEESLAFLQEASSVEDIKEFEEIVTALSYSPNREADKMLLSLAAESGKSAQIVGRESVRRMIAGDPEDAQRMDFAEPMLKLAMDTRLIKYLDRVHEARALRALMYCLRNGVEEAAESLIVNAEGLENLSSADSKVAAKAIRDVMEYIEVSHLRGGVAARMKVEDKYVYWKGLQAKAGRVLLEVHQPEAESIPGFDDSDLDL